VGCDWGTEKIMMFTTEAQRAQRRAKKIGFTTETQRAQRKPGVEKIGGLFRLLKCKQPEQPASPLPQGRIVKGLKIELTWTLENLPSPLFAKEG